MQLVNTVEILMGRTLENGIFKDNAVELEERMVPSTVLTKVVKGGRHLRFAALMVLVTVMAVLDLVLVAQKFQKQSVRLLKI